MKIVYHGSFVSVPEPLTNVGRRELDFGPGFYVTTIREQAERWARRVCVIRATDTPLLSKYEFSKSRCPLMCVFSALSNTTANGSISS